MIILQHIKRRTGNTLANFFLYFMLNERKRGIFVKRQNFAVYFCAQKITIILIFHSNFFPKT